MASSSGARLAPLQHERHVQLCVQPLLLASTATAASDSQAAKRQQPQPAQAGGGRAEHISGRLTHHVRAADHGQELWRFVVSSSGSTAGAGGTHLVCLQGTQWRALDAQAQATAALALAGAFGGQPQQQGDGEPAPAPGALAAAEAACSASWRKAQAAGVHGAGDLVGRCIRVWWPSDLRWYEGLVTDHYGGSSSSSAAGSSSDGSGGQGGGNTPDTGIRSSRDQQGAGRTKRRRSDGGGGIQGMHRVAYMDGDVELADLTSSISSNCWQLTAATLQQLGGADGDSSCGEGGDGGDGGGSSPDSRQHGHRTAPAPPLPAAGPLLVCLAPNRPADCFTAPASAPAGAAAAAGAGAHLADGLHLRAAAAGATDAGAAGRTLAGSAAARGLRPPLPRRPPAAAAASASVANSRQVQTGAASGSATPRVAARSAARAKLQEVFPASSRVPRPLLAVVSAPTAAAPASKRPVQDSASEGTAAATHAAGRAGLGTATAAAGLGAAPAPVANQAHGGSWSLVPLLEAFTDACAPALSWEDPAASPPAAVSTRAPCIMNAAPSGASGSAARDGVSTAQELLQQFDAATRRAGLDAAERDASSLCVVASGPNMQLGLAPWQALQGRTSRAPAATASGGSHAGSHAQLAALLLQLGPGLLPASVRVTATSGGLHVSYATCNSCGVTGAAAKASHRRGGGDDDGSDSGAGGGCRHTAATQLCALPQALAWLTAGAGGDDGGAHDDGHSSSNNDDGQTAAAPCARGGTAAGSGSAGGGGGRLPRVPVVVALLQVCARTRCGKLLVLGKCG